MKIYTVTTTEKIDYDFTMNCYKNGAFKKFKNALKKWCNEVEKFKIIHKQDIMKYSNKEEYPDEESGGIFMLQDDEDGYFVCGYGFQEDHQVYVICIDEWKVED